MQKTVIFLRQLRKTGKITSEQIINLSFRYTFLSFLIIACFFTTISFGQGENQADQALRGSGRVNASSLGMEIDIPLGSYPGRGITIPISLSYSSKVWRVDFSHLDQARVLYGAECTTVNRAVYSENAASGWTTSLATPYIEYVGKDNLFDESGFPASTADTCSNAPSTQTYSYTRRLSIHLPGGESHELRADDTITTYSSSSHCPPSGNYVCDPNDAKLQENWNRTYYAVDGSNIKYIEDSATNTYRLLMPDGSSYNFESSLSSVYQKTARKAVKFTDRNGNFTSYNTTTGVWTDTLGKTFTSPIGASAPVSPTAANAPLEYSMPGMTGKYKFHWKYLKGSSEAESGLTDFSQSLKYKGDKLHMINNGAWQPIPSGSESLFSSIEPRTYILAEGLFNPVVLTEIELPTGQSYKFKYDIYGQIEIIYYPTGGEEQFVYNTVAPLAESAPNNVTDQANFGVTNRKLFPAAGQSANYEWNYNVTYTAPSGYKVSTTSPDGTINERILHRGNGACPGGCTQGTFGYDNGLAGMPYEELNFSNTGQLVTRKLTHWTLTGLPVWIETVNGGYNFGNIGNWHPRVTHEQSYIYDSTGNGVYGTTKYEYEGNLGLRESPVLQKKTLEYAFVTTSGGGSITPGGTPNPNPTPTSTPTPPTLLRTSETTYLINDADTYPEWVRDIYKAKNMVGLVRTATVKDGAGTIVSRSEMKYDDGGLSPEIGRGNPTTAKIWDSTKGAWNNVNAYIPTYAKFDTYGNVIETTDGKGNVSYTQYADNYSDNINRNSNALPTKTISYSGANGTGTMFESTVKYDFNTGLPVSTTDPNGQTTTMSYADPITGIVDPLLRIRKVTAPNGHQTITEYGEGTSSSTRYTKVKTQIDANNWKEGYSWYDGLGRTVKSQSVASDGDVFVDTEYDQFGRPWKTTNPYRTGETIYKTENFYDTAGRVHKVKLPDGAEVETFYSVATTGDQKGTVITVEDQANKQRRSITNALGQLTRVDEPDINNQLGAINAPNQATYYTYDPISNLLTVSQGVQTRSFVYDSQSRVKQSTNPELGTINYNYDNNGNLIKKTDARVISTIYDYDALNRVIMRCYTIPNMAVNPLNCSGVTGANVNQNTLPVTFIYDDPNIANSKGNLTKVVTGNVNTPFSVTEYQQFDTMGRVKQSQQVTDGTISDPMTYTYNLSGALVEQKYPSGRVVKNVLDNDGELSIIQSKKNQTAGYWDYAKNFTFTASGAVSSMQLGNGKWESTVFNSRLQPTKIALGTVQGGDDKLNLVFDYGMTNNNGNVLSQTINVQAVGSAPGFTAVQNYTYDSLNRLKSATENLTQNQTTAMSWRQTYKYDRYGNRTFDEGSSGGQFLTTTLPRICGSSPNFTVCPADNPAASTANNRLNGFTFDTAGNIQEDPGGREFIYDGENKQILVRDSSGNKIGEYFYDGDGKRVKKVEFSSNVPIQTTIFIYDADGKMVAEYATNVEQVSTARVSYLTSDHLGSPRITTDKDGKVFSRRDFMPFGEEIMVNHTLQRSVNLNYGEDGLRQKFTTYERDDETDLDFAQARMNNYNLGRFTSPDPMMASASRANPQTFNRYAYVSNNPINFIDPTGMMTDYVSKDTGRVTTINDGIDQTIARTDKQIKDSQYLFAVNSKAYYLGLTTIERSSDNLHMTRAEFTTFVSTIYAETSGDYSETFGIVNVLENRAKADDTSVKAQATVAVGGVNGEDSDQYTKDGLTAAGMIKANTVRRAIANALSTEIDITNGAFFWDGLDFNGKNARHGGYSARYVPGYLFTNPNHDLFKQGNNKNKKGTYVYESTNAIGKTTFTRLHNPGRRWNIPK